LSLQIVETAFSHTVKCVEIVSSSKVLTNNCLGIYQYEKVKAVEVAEIIHRTKRLKNTEHFTYTYRRGISTQNNKIT